jgi:SnoaL-like domain
VNQPGPGKRSAEDTLAIQAVVVLYGFVLDDREWDRFDQVFTQDAVVDFRDQSASPPTGLAPIVGRAEIVRMFRDVLTHPYQHMLVNHVIDDVTPDEVLVRSKALLPMPGGSVADIMYRDTVVRTADGWRIARKEIKRYNFDPPAPWGIEQAKIWHSRGARFA